MSLLPFPRCRCASVAQDVSVKLVGRPRKGDSQRSEIGGLRSPRKLFVVRWGESLLQGSLVDFSMFSAHDTL